MSRTTDVIVIGSGLAGLMAAYAAAKKGASVKVVSEGMGCLSISPGCIDVLGYDKDGKRLENPWSGFGQLEENHPYSLIGEDNVKIALQELADVVSARGLKLESRETNSLLPTIMGTFKPSWLVPAEVKSEEIQKAERLLVLTIRGFRDCRPQLIVSQLRRYPGWENKDYQTLVLPAPFDEHARALNALDLAHFLDLPHGRDWLMNRIKGLGKGRDLALIPPMLGAKPDSRIRTTFAEGLGCPFVEMLSVPPGVAGLRIRQALVDALIEMGVEFYENAQVAGAKVSNGKCESINLHASGRDMTQSAKTYVAATGGIIGGGVILEQGKAKEAIFGLEIPVPADVDKWSEPDIFGRHLVTRIGVEADKNLQARGLENVYFAGRTLGGYDYAAEKSGHGVACSTGWHAGNLAANQALGGN